MEAGVMALIIGVVLIIVFIIIGAIFTATKKAPVDPELLYAESYKPLVGWSTAKPSSDITKNSCKLYNFPGVTETAAAYPGQPTLNYDILLSMTPQNEPSCVDIDQIVARQVIRTCTDLTGQNPNVFCTEFDGTQVPPGTGEVYFEDCQVGACTGILSFVAVNYQPCFTYPGCLLYPPCSNPQVIDTALCMTISTNQQIISGQACDIGDSNQIFRLTQKSAGSTTQGKNGVLTNLYWRQGNACVAPSRTNPFQLALSQDSTACQQIWYLCPPLFGTSLTAPQQIVYIGDLSQTELSQLNATQSYDKLLELITGLNLRSIQVTSDTDPTFVLKPFATYAVCENPIPDEALKATAQTIPYNLFNTILYTTQPSIMG